DTALVASPAAPYSFYQRAGRCLQINNEVRHRRPRTQRLVDFLVQGQLVARQRDAREKRVFVEEEIGHRRLAGHVGLNQRLEHSGALEQEEQLRRQRKARHVLVTTGEERVLRRLLEQQLGR